MGQPLVCCHYTLENSTLCLCILDIRLGNNSESEFVG